MVLARVKPDSRSLVYKPPIPGANILARKAYDSGAPKLAVRCCWMQLEQILGEALNLRISCLFPLRVGEDIRGTGETSCLFCLLLLRSALKVHL